MAGAVAEPRKGQAGCAHHAPRRLLEHRSFLGSDGAAWPALSTLKRIMGDEKAFRSFSPEESPPSWLPGLKSYLRHLCRVRVIAPARPATQTLISHGPSSRCTASAQPLHLLAGETGWGWGGVGRTSPPCSRGLKEVGNHSGMNYSGMKHEALCLPRLEASGTTSQPGKGIRSSAGAPGWNLYRTQFHAVGKGGGFQVQPEATARSQLPASETQCRRAPAPPVTAGAPPAGCNTGAPQGSPRGLSSVLLRHLHWGLL